MKKKLTLEPLYLRLGSTLVFLQSEQGDIEHRNRLYQTHYKEQFSTLPEKRKTHYGVEVSNKLLN